MEHWIFMLSLWYSRTNKLSSHAKDCRFEQKCSPKTSESIMITIYK